MIRIIQKASQIYKKYGSQGLDFIALKLGVDIHEVLEGSVKSSVALIILIYCQISVAGWHSG
jgi:hypothetical protein